MNFRKLISYLILFLLPTGALFSQNDCIIVINKDECINIGNLVYFYDDVTNKYTIDSIDARQFDNIFTKSNKKVPNFGRTKSSVWCKFIVRNLTENEIFLELANSSVDYFEFYSKNNTDTFVRKLYGSNYPFHSRIFKNNFFLVLLPTSGISKSDTFYLRFKSENTLELPLKTGTLKSFFEKNHTMDFGYGIYFGLIIVLVLYNFFIFLSVKDKAYLYYVLFILFTGLANATYKGYSFEFFWPYLPEINYFMHVFFTIPLILTIILFSSYFLETEKYAPRLHWGLYALTIMVAIDLLLFLFSNYQLAQLISELTGFAACVYLLTISVFLYIKGRKSVRFYIFAWTFFVIGVTVNLLGLNNILPINSITYNGILIGSALEGIFFSFALADKINFMKRERESEHAAHIEYVKQQNQLLEEKVEERTHEINEKNQELVVQNEEIKQQQEELTAINDSLEETVEILNETTERLNSSIRYAKSMQEIILPTENELEQFFSGQFIIYLPKDLVSGDFYWFYKFDENAAIFALADCTGHGVPAAFMSMISSTLLYDISKYANIKNPATIFSLLHRNIQTVLRQKESTNFDGMDVSLVLFEKNLSESNFKITFAGAKSSIFFCMSDEIVRITGGKKSIGGYEDDDESEFFTKEYILPLGTTVYFSTDGFFDQNNSEQRKIGISLFKDILDNVKDSSMQKQKEVLLSILTEHKGEEPQRDDISVVGLKC